MGDIMDNMDKTGETIVFPTNPAFSGNVGNIASSSSSEIYRTLKDLYRGMIKGVERQNADLLEKLRKGEI